MSFITPLSPATFYEQSTSMADVADQTAHSLAGLASRNPTAELPADQRQYTHTSALLPEGSDVEAGPSPEAIRRLEEAPLLAERKYSLLLASLGDKPMGMAAASSASWHDGEPEQSVPEETSRLILELVHDLGLHAHILERTSSGDKDDGAVHQRFRIFTASHSPALLDLIDTAFEQQSNEDKWMMGQAFGYPPTAIEAYVHGRGVSPRTVTDDLELLAFAQFKLSPEHAREELELGRRWANRVREISPVIYQEALEQAL